MNQTIKNDKKPYFGPDFNLFGPNVGPKKFSWVLPLLDFMHCCKVSLCATSWKSNEPSFRKRKKTSFWARLWTIRSKFGALFFVLFCFCFFQKSGFLSHYISWSAIIMYNIKKTNDLIFRKRSEGQMHWWRDKQTDQ